ncbi:hypothetical protein [Embleya sp. AB8]|uniref:hypothetical protein n=1 Tax=Embleya sp. AB8 TaxID=3156304 RepID=UPI003C76B440
MSTSTSTEVDLASGRVTVSADAALDDAAVTAAVGEAGYEVVAPVPTEVEVEAGAGAGASCCGSCH